MRTRPAGLLVRLLSPFALVLCTQVTPVAAAQPEDCPQWFPDFHCDRSGRYEGFQRPIFAPFMFEDPFITTGIYPYYIWHEFPRASALGGGHVQALAVQARLAITDRLALIATKDGFIWEEPDSPILTDQKGFLNLAGGLKYALIDDPEDQFILSSALRLEVKTGARDLFEGGTDVLFIPSLSAAWGLDQLHFIGDVGGQVPTDGRENSSLVFYHFYADYALAPRFQPFVQISGILYVESGDGSRPVRTKLGTLPLSTVESLVGEFEGVDLHNLGASGVDNNGFAAIGVGAHVPISKHVTFSFGYERPLSERHDIFKQRITTSLRMEY